MGVLGEVMQEIIENFAEENHIDIIKAVDISSLSLEENRGYLCAILLVKVLPKEYIDKLNHEKETDYTVLQNYVKQTDELADKLVTVIQEKGYRAISQSENAIDFRGEYDEKTKSSILPHKKNSCNVWTGVDWKKRFVNYGKIWSGTFYVFCSYRLAFGYG